MFAQRFWNSFKKTRLPAGRERKVRARKADDVVEQVRQVLQTADQKLILMVRN